MLHLIWWKLLTGEDLTDVGYTSWLSYLWRWVIKGMAGYSLYFPILQTQRHNADQGNFSSPRFKGLFLFFVRKSQIFLVLKQFKVPITFGCGAGASSGIAVVTGHGCCGRGVVTVRPWMLWQRGGDCQWGHGCCGREEVTVRPWMLWQRDALALSRRDFSLSAVLTSNASTLATVCTRGNPNFWRQLLELLPSPPPFQAEEQQCVYGVQGWFQAEECGWQGGRRGMGCRNWQHCSPSSLSFDTHTTQNRSNSLHFLTPLTPKQAEEGTLAFIANLFIHQ